MDSQIIYLHSFLWVRSWSHYWKTGKPILQFNKHTQEKVDADIRLEPGYAVLYITLSLFAILATVTVVATRANAPGSGRYARPF